MCFRLLSTVLFGLLYYQSSFAAVVPAYRYPGAVKLLEQKSNRFPDSVESRMYLIGFSKALIAACGKMQVHAMDPSFGIYMTKYLLTYPPSTEGMADGEAYVKRYDCAHTAAITEQIAQEQVKQSQREPNPEDRAKFALLQNETPDPVKTEFLATWWRSLLGTWVDEKADIQMVFYLDGTSKMSSLGGRGVMNHFATPDFRGGDIMTTVTDDASGAQAVFYDCVDRVRLEANPGLCQAWEKNHHAEATRNADGTLDVTFQAWVGWKNSWSQHSFHLVRQQ